MKLAHLVLAHNHPLQLERLVKRLSDADAHVYIHLDAKTDIAGFEHIGSIPNTSFIKNRVNVKWGEYSTIQGTLNAMEEILAAGTTYSHINLLSGADYPLQSNAATQKFLFANADKTFMWYDQIFDNWVHGQVRINKYDFGDYGFPGRYQAAQLVNKILPDRKLPGNMIAYGRAQWLTITPESAAYVINFIKNNRAARRFLRMTWCVDEVFFQTILCNSPLKDKIVNDNLRYIELDPGFRPVVITTQHLDRLLASGKFFARKFDYNIDSAIFDELDKAVR